MRDIWGFSSNPEGSLLTRSLEELEDGKNKRLRIVGGIPLAGEIENAGGAKNTVTPMLLAACLPQVPYTRSYLHNIPNTTEVRVAVAFIEAINAAKVRFLPNTSSMEITSLPPDDSPIPSQIGKLARASIIGAGFKLAKHRYADIPVPEGDDLGERDITTHIKVYRAFGAHVDDSVPGRLRFSAPEGLKGCTVDLSHPRITATIGGIFAATGAEGKTILKNTSQDPEVDALISCLDKAGVNIQRLPTTQGKPSRTIVIEEAKSINGFNYRLPIDRTAALFYGVSAIMTGSRQGVFVAGAKEEEMSTSLSLLEEMGAGCKAEREGIWFFHKFPLRAPERLVNAMNEPCLDTKDAVGLPPDTLPSFTALFLQAKGKTLYVEGGQSDRFHHFRAVQERIPQGVASPFLFFNPPEDMAKPFYLYDPSRSNSPHGVVITGGLPLHPFTINGRDIRSDAFWVTQGLATHGTSYLDDLRHLQRGYPNLDANLRGLGANISVENNF